MNRKEASAHGPLIAAAFVYPDIEPARYLKRTAAIAQALDLTLEVVPTNGVDRSALEGITRELGGEMLGETMDPSSASADALGASLVALPLGKTAAKLANAPLDHDLFIVGAEQTYIGENLARSPYAHTAGDRMRVGYGKLIVYLGAAAGAGKTYAALQHTRRLVTEGTDAVVAVVDRRGHTETEALLSGLEVLRTKTVVSDGKTYAELDRDALLARHPRVAMIDALAHTNAPGSVAPKRFHDVLAALRAGIDVITTLNIAQLEGLGDTIARLTGATVRDTLPDGILALVDDLIFIDVTPETLQQRLTEGKIYAPERIEAARSTYFRTEALVALRQLALREAQRARSRGRIASPFERIMLAVGSREADLPMIPRAGRVAARLAIEFSVAHVTDSHETVDERAVEALKNEARKTNTEWIEDSSDQVPKRLLEIARSKPETTIALAGTLRSPRLFGRPSFARRLLDAGARELLVLTQPETGNPPLPEE